MSTKRLSQKSSPNRAYRYFSESFRRKKVDEIDRNLTKVADVCREYGVSRSGVYKWIYQYSSYRKKQIRQIIEPMSDTHKIKELEKKVRELERLVGQKQILLEFNEKLIEVAENMYKVDIKKKLGSKLSGTSGPTKEETPGA